VTAEAHPQCGQSGRVRRVFWRAGAPWVLVHCSSGMLLMLPWAATDLPQPVAEELAAVGERAAPLLSPAALLGLARFLRQHAGGAAIGVLPRRLP
jgi:hypothetical protein